jgi:DNA-binding NtrC family response regulator
VAEQKCVLVVDDDEQVLFFLQETLQALGPWCKVHVARNGLEAAGLLTETPYALVITDLRMPGIDGQELTEMIRKTNQETVVIWITAFRGHETDLAAQRLAVYCCLEKPVRAAQMRRIVPKALGLDHRSSSAANAAAI